MKATRSDIAGEHLVEARLVERHGARLKDRDLCRVDVDPDDLVAEFGHARGMGRSEITGPDDGESQGHGRKATADSTSGPRSPRVGRLR